MPINFYIVGGVARGKKPRDIDIVGVMSNEDFERIYKIDPRGELYLLLKIEKLDDLTPEKLIKWRNENTGMRRILEQIYPYCWIDYKIIPENLLDRKKAVIPITLDELEKYKP